MTTGFLLITITHLLIYTFTHSFMQNKPNLLDTQMNANLVLTKDYENESAFGVHKNKPNQTQFHPHRLYWEISVYGKSC